MIKIRRRKDQDGIFVLYFTINGLRFQVDTRTVDKNGADEIQEVVESYIREGMFNKKEPSSQWVLQSDWQYVKVHP